VKTALLVGGTGPSGPHLVEGLLDRGYDVVMFHTGRHELDGMPDLEHVHGDPYSREGIAEALDGRSFDAVLATYGKVREIARVMAGRCGQFVSVGGTPVYLGFVSPDVTSPRGLPVHVREDAPRVPPEGIPGAVYGVGAIRRTEDVIFDLHAEGAFAASVFRYPSIYGPRNPHAWEWSTIKRVRDGRPFIVVPDGGLAVHSRLSARNAAHSVLLALDHPETAAGQAFNCADDDQYMLRQWIELILAELGAELEIVSLPGDLPSPGWALMVFRYECSPHVIVDTTKIRTLLGYRDILPARACLAETVEWLVGNEARSHQWPVLDPFDYEAEDRLVAQWRAATADLEPAAARYQEIPTMPFPQTASGSRVAEEPDRAP
jgi:nucleoside-diphosphate-sugar epimerase